MARKSINYYLIKVLRISGWILFPLMILYICTGFALCGKLGFTRAISMEEALRLHKIFDWPLVGVFFVHSLIGIYLAMRRWGWIRKRKRA